MKNLGKLIVTGIIQFLIVNCYAQKDLSFFPLKIGEIEVVALSDGFVATDAHQLLQEGAHGQIDSLLAKAGLNNPVEIQVNVFLILSGKRKILIDTGSGDFLNNSSSGKLVQSLKMIGFRPEDITDILLTHVHADHSGGLTHNGIVVFPSAVIHLNQGEYDYWMDDTNLDGLTGYKRDFFLKEQKILTAYRKKIRTFSGPTQLFPEIKAVPMPGHTPGHTAYELDSKGEKVLFWGDMVHIKEIQFIFPDFDDRYDVDINRGKERREKVYRNMAKEKIMIAGAHIEFPGIGRLKTDKERYKWEPID